MIFFPWRKKASLPILIFIFCVGQSCLAIYSQKEFCLSSSRKLSYFLQPSINPEVTLGVTSQDLLDAKAFSGSNIQLGQVSFLNMGHCDGANTQIPGLKTTKNKIPHCKKATIGLSLFLAKCTCPQHSLAFS